MARTRTADELAIRVDNPNIGSGQKTAAEKGTKCDSFSTNYATN